MITHTHSDHIDGIAEVFKTYSVPIYVHKNGTSYIDYKTETIDEGQTIELGGIQIEVIYTPGHNDDSVCYYVAKNNAVNQTPLLITGDTLFVQGCGRTTETRVKDLYESLQEIKNLPDDTLIYPGHDYGPTPTSSIAEEKVNNRFLMVKNFDEFYKLRMG